MAVKARDIRVREAMRRLAELGYVYEITRGPDGRVRTIRWWCP